MKTLLGALFTTTCALSVGYSDGFAPIEYLPQSEQLTSAEYAELVNPIQRDCQHLSQAELDYLDESGVLAGKGEFPTGDPTGAQLGTSSEMIETDASDTDQQSSASAPTPSSGKSYFPPNESTNTSPSTGKSYFPPNESTGTDSGSDASSIPTPEVSGKRQAPLQPDSKGGVYPEPNTSSMPMRATD